VFRHLNLEAGAHHLEIEAAGYPPFAFGSFERVQWREIVLSAELRRSSGPS
jgi:hypothetical protein